MKIIKPGKSLLDRLLGDWWVDVAVALFVIGMLAITHLLKE